MRAFLRWLLEPAASLSEPEDRHQARTVAATLLLTLVLIVVPLFQRSSSTETPIPWLLTLLGIGVAYAASRTRYYRQGAFIAILTLWLLPTYTILLIGMSSSVSFVLAIGRLLLLSLLMTYIMISLRASIVLGAAMLIIFLINPTAPGTTPSLQRASDFLLTTASIFMIFVITRQYELAKRREAEAAQRATEALYRAIVESQTEMLVRWLPDTTLTFVNDAYCRYFGKPREELIGTKFSQVVFGDDFSVIRSAFGTITPEKPTITYEHRVITPAGAVGWLQWTDRAIFNARGSIIEYQSAGRDITSLKRAEEAEREERQFAEALIATAALISSTLDLDEVLDRILERIAALSPLNSAEVMLIDDGTAGIVRTIGYQKPEDRAALMNLRLGIGQARNLRTMVETGKPLIIDDVREDSEWIDVEASRWIRASCGAPIRLEGETIGFLNITSDMPGAFTDQHARRLQAFADQAAIALRNARLYDKVSRHADELERQVSERTAELDLERQRLRVILDGTGEGMFYTEDDRIQFANVAFYNLTGYTQGELVGQSYHQLYEENSQIPILDSAHDEVSRHGIWRGEFHIRRKDGSLCPVGLTISLIGTNGARPFRAVTVVRDISREKMLQAQRTNFVAYASHELRTPITNMKTRLYLLRRRPEFLEEHLVILDEVTERMRQLVDDLLDMSRLEHGIIPMRRQDVNVQEVVETVITLQKPEAERSSLALDWMLSPDPILVSGDRERLIQVLTNLVTNAINYTPAGGRINVSVRQDDSKACIEVADTGIGIAPDNLPHIFQPFYRVVSSVEGTGLGLSIAKQIVELHGGTLGVHSELQRGSVFTITLPLQQPTQNNHAHAD
ncbi:MAG: PAS domain S-box protein [Anaerolineae bacterium]|nr:PAS domain S-box protein [Anaerolineae bacterium]